jgi:hypothetical protein
MSTSINEHVIRDALGEDLAILEPGLKLIEKEYKLPNPVGGKGFIDILARDRFGMRVVIELKRSDNTARQAIHEIYKYTALIKMIHGLSAEQIRCMVVSTDWHELRVPFSAFEQSVEYSVDGYEIQIDREGRPIAAKQIAPLKEQDQLELCPTGLVFLFRSDDTREATRPAVEIAAAEVGVVEYLLIEQDFLGDNPGVIYPFGLSFSMAIIDPVSRSEIEEKLELEIDPEEESVGNPWYFEEVLQGEIGSRVHPDVAMDVEITYPDKFRAHEANWPPKRIRRYGTRLSSDLRSDDDLLDMVRSDVGGHSSIFSRVGSPRLVAAWARTRQDLNQCLLGNSAWESEVNGFLDELESEDAVDVSVDVFNPTDIVMGLFKLGAENTTAYLPAAQIVVQPEGDDGLRVATGGLSWDRDTVRTNPQDMLDQFFDGEVMNYFMARTLGEVWSQDDALLSWHGLGCALYELVISREAVRASHLSLRDGNLSRSPLDEAEPIGASLRDFAAIHQQYLSLLAAMIRGQSIGI